MSERPHLADAEWDLILELLLVELEELPNEIHHASPMERRDELRARRKMVEELVEKLQAPVHG